MAPGVVGADPQIKKDDVVFVREETHGKYIALGEALVDGSEMIGKVEGEVVRKGRVVKTIHSVGDDIWSLM